MARKKQEIALQVEIETQEEWEEMLAKEGLTGKMHFCYWEKNNLHISLALRVLKMYLTKSLSSSYFQLWTCTRNGVVRAKPWRVSSAESKTKLVMTCYILLW